jgi:hypothetical protein
MRESSGHPVSKFPRPPPHPPYTPYLPYTPYPDSKRARSPLRQDFR